MLLARFLLLTVLRLVVAAFLAFGAAKSFEKGRMAFDALGGLLALVTLTTVALAALALAAAFDRSSPGEA